MIARLKRRKRVRANIRQSDRIECSSHLKFVRGFICVAAGSDCSGRTESHHVREGAGAGMGRKPGDDRAVPLCGHHHGEGHTKGWKWFAATYSVDLLKIAAAVWRRSTPGRKYRMEREKQNDHA